MEEEKNKGTELHERWIDNDLHKYVKMIVPSIEEHRIIDFTYFCSVAKDVFSYALKNETFVTYMIFDLYNKSGRLDNNQLHNVANRIKEVTRSDDIISIDYKSSAIFLLMPDAGWSGGVVNIEQRISESCKQDNIKIDTYCAMMPSMPEKILSLDKDAKHKEYFIGRLRDLFVT